MTGARGWTIPYADFSKEDEAIYKREGIRLSLSLEGAQKDAEGRRQVAMMHFPPFNEKRQPSEFTALFEKYGVEKVVYGHLHGDGLKAAYNGVVGGVEYVMVSCDYTDFKLVRIF